MILSPPAPPARPPSGRLVTADELMQHPEWGPCELVRGKVVPVCRPNNEHGMLVAEMSLYVGGFISRHKLGRFFAGDSGVFAGRNPDTVRGPDLHFVRADRWPGKSALKKFLEVSPDLCIEILSPNDPLWKVEEKVNEYLAIGVPLVWVLDPKTRGAFVYRPNAEREEIPPSGVLSGEGVLPGFKLPLSELYAVLD